MQVALLATLLALACLAHGATVSRTVTLNASTQDCGAALCDPLSPTMMFAASEFGCAGDAQITDVNLVITAQRTLGTCAAPTAPANWRTVTYALDLVGETEQVRLVGSNDMQGVTEGILSFGFDDSSTVGVATTGGARSGIFHPDTSLTAFQGVTSSAFEFQLIAGERDNSVNGVLCTYDFSITMSAECPVAVTKSTPMSASTDGCGGSYCDPLTPTLTFDISDFSCPAGSVLDIGTVKPTVTFLKTAGTCATPAAGDPDNNEMSYALDIVGGPRVLLVRRNDYFGASDGMTVTTTFADDAGTLFTTPTTGTTLPRAPLGNLRRFLDSTVEFQLVAGDATVGNPLCTSAFSVEMTALCVEAPVTLNSCVVMDESTDDEVEEFTASVISFQPSDFGCADAMRMQDVAATVDFLKTSGTCASPTSDPPGVVDFFYSLQSDAGTSPLEDTMLRFGTYNVDVAMPSPVSVRLGPQTAQDFASGSPVSGDFLPALDVFNDVATESIFGFVLTGRDRGAGNPLCTFGFCVDLAAFCDVPPIFTSCPADITSDCSPTVAYSVLATDTDLLFLTQGLPSGSDFPVGTTTVEYQASNAGGVVSCSFDVTVSDDMEDPVITCPADIVQMNDAGLCTAVVTYTEPTATDNCGGVTVTRVSGPPSGNNLPVGSRSVTYRATDTEGNEATCSFLITVTDVEDPTLSDCPMDITVPNTANRCSAPVSYTPPSADDNCSVSAQRIQGPAPGSTFPVGTTLIRYEAVDASGLTSPECQFTITVTDSSAPVVMNCPSDMTVSSDAGSCGAAVSFMAPTATDNCSTPTVTQTAGPTSGSSFPVGTTSVAFEATDDEGNVTPCTFQVTVTDGESPSVVSCPADIMASADAGACDAVVTYTEPTADDNCPGATIARTGGSLASGSAFPIGVTTVTHEATDAAGNVSPVCSFTVTVTDDESPSVVSCPADIMASTDAGACDAVVTYTEPTADDNCPGATIARTGGSLASGSAFPIGVTTVTHEATDAAGNVSPVCSFTVTVTDDEVPTIDSCPSAMTVSSDAGECSAEVTFSAPSASDNCPGVTVSQTAGPSSGDDFPVGTTTVTFVATDAAGNPSAPCSFTVTVTDDEVPTVGSCPSDITTTTDPGDCTAFVTFPTPTAEDNCPGATIARTAGPASGSQFAVGVTTVTFVATDAASNPSAACTFTVTVTDDEPAVATCPGDVAVSSDAGDCAAVVTYTQPTAVDNCAGSMIALTAGLASGSSFPVGVTTVTYEATDVAGNTPGECSFTVTVTDMEAPTVVNCPADMTVGNDAGECDAVVTYTEPTAADNCAGATISRTGPAPGDTFPLGATTVSFVATDAEGNMSGTCSFVVTVEDREAPTVDSCPSPMTVSSDAGVCGAVVPFMEPTAADNCPGATISRTAGLGPGSEFPVGTTTVTYQATDGASNTSSDCTFTVTVTDDEAPTVVSCPADITVTSDSGSCDAVVTYTDPTAADNCPGATVARTGLASGSTFPVGTSTVTFVATDGAGNMSPTCSFTVTVTDDEVPAVVSCPADITTASDAGDCGAVVGYVEPTANDNCPGASVARTGLAPGSTFPVGVSTVSYVATDAAGNVSPTCSFTVTVTDNEDPTVVSCPSDISVSAAVGSCGRIVTYTAPTADDNCPAATVARTGLASGSTFPVGVSTVSYVATDAAGNTSPTCMFTVTVTDDELPTAMCPGDITVNSDAGACSAVATFAGASASDNCPGATAAQTGGLASGSAFPVGSSMVSFQATDAAGNLSAECSFTVTVADNEAPGLVGCPADIVTTSDGSDCAAVVMYTAPTSTDNCAGSSVQRTAGPASGSSFPAGVTTVTHVASDAASNLSAPCSFTVTVTDNEDPTLAGCPGNIAAMTDASSCSALVSYTAPSGADNCPGVVVNRIGGPASGNFFPLGTTTVQHEAEDTSGNTSPVCSFSVSVTDNVVPSVSCPADVAVATSNGRNSAVVSYATPSTSDNCPGVQATLVSGPASGSDLAIGVYTVVYTATDSSGNTGSTCSFSITVTLGVDELPDTCVPNDAVGTFSFAPTQLNTPLTVQVNIPAAFEIKTLEVVVTGQFTNQGDLDVALSHGGFTSTLSQATCAGSALMGTVTFADGAGATCSVSNGRRDPVTPLSTFNGQSVQGVWTLTFQAVGGFPPATVIAAEIRAQGFGIPQINCFSASVTNDPGLCSAVVFYREPNTCSVRDTAVVTRNGPESGSTFAVGQTAVQYQLTAGSQTDSCTTTVTVVDAELPVVTGCPANMVVTADAGATCGATVAWSEASIVRTDNCGLTSVSQTHSPGDFIGVGVTNVVYSGADGAGNSNSCSFTVTVEDASAPVYTNCPERVTAESSCSDSGTVVTWTEPTLTADCLTYATSNVQPGERFRDGATTVAYVAIQGQSFATCTFEVVVAACQGEAGGNRPPGAFGTIDLDGDGYYSDAPLFEWRDCCDSPEDHCDDPFVVNPGAYEIAHNGQEDSCRGIGATGDLDSHAGGCDTQQIVGEDLTLVGPTISSQETEKVAYAMDLCEFKDDDDDPSWGFGRQESLTFTLANGTRNGYDIGIDGPHVSQAAVLRKLGQITPVQGEYMVAISTGTARDEATAGSVAPTPGFATGNSAVNLPATFLDGGLGDFVEDCAREAYGVGLDSIRLQMAVHQPTNMRAFSLQALYLDNELEAAQGSYPAGGACDSRRQSWFLAIKTDSETGVSASGNFAGDNSGRSFNSYNDNGGFWQQCRNYDAGSGACAQGHRDLAGSGYGGGSGWTTIGTSAAAGERFSLELVTFEGGDTANDVTVLLDDYMPVGEARTKGSDSWASRPWGYQYEADVEVVFLAPLGNAFVLPRASATSVTMEFTVRNWGPEEANDLFVSFTPPVGTRFASAKDSSGSSLTCTATAMAAPYEDQGHHRCQLRQNPSVAAGSSVSGSVSFEVDVECEACGSSLAELRFRMTASHSSVDRELGNNYLTSLITLV